MGKPVQLIISQMSEEFNTPSIQSSATGYKYIPVCPHHLNRELSGGSVVRDTEALS